MTKARLTVRKKWNFEGIATFICKVSKSMCGDVFTRDAALFAGMQMQND